MAKSTISREAKLQRIRELLIEIDNFIKRRIAFSFTVLLAKCKVRWSSNIMAMRNIMIELNLIVLDTNLAGVWNWTELGSEITRAEMADLILTRSESKTKDYLQNYKGDVNKDEIGEPPEQDEEDERDKKFVAAHDEVLPVVLQTTSPTEVQEIIDLNEVDWVIIKMSLGEFIHTHDDEVYVSVAKRVLQKIS